MIKTCPVSGQKFNIETKDLTFYQKMGVPTPTLCPHERLRRRLAFRPKNMYLRPCDKTGKMAMSSYAPELKQVTVYSHEAFWDESFDGISFGRDFDFSRPFFEQFMEMHAVVPKNGSNTYQNQNSDYMIYSSHNRDCYLIDESDESQNCYFGYDYQRCKDMAGCLHTHDSEIGYELIWAENCYNTFYSRNVFHCIDSAFLMNCRSCRKCLFCTNLRNKEYHIFNKPVPQEEFEKYWNYIFAGKQTNIEECKQQFESFLEKQFFPQWIQVNCEDATGNFLFNCKNVNDSFCTDKCQDCRFCTNIHHSRDCYDVHIYEGELMYECCHMGPEGYHQIGVFSVWFSKNTFYCTDSFHLKDCLGCTGLKNKQYCIFNKQYEEEEYHRLKDRIINHMKDTGEWGEFFPMEMSPYPYNESMASRFCPLSQEQALNWNTKLPSRKGSGLGWLENTSASNASSANNDIPNDINGITESITKQTFWDEKAQKTFKFVPQEITFYKKYGIPLPTYSPLQRIDNLFETMGGYQLFERTCDGCGQKMKTNFSPDFKGKVLCEKCYLKQIH